MKSLEILSLKIGKWHIPKSKPIVDTTYNYICLGCYNAFDISVIEGDSSECVYEHIKRDREKDKNSGMYADRRIVMFRDTKNTKFKLDFNKPVFVSLLNIENAVFDLAEKNINSIFKEKNLENNYAIYYSFDYSDFVLVAQGISIDDFNKAIFELNYYDCCEYIYDTFTIYGIPTEEVRAISEWTDKEKTKVKAEHSTINSKYVADFYLDITDISILDEIENMLSENNYDYSVTDFSFGRNDYLLSVSFDTEIQLACVLLIIDNLSLKVVDSIRLVINEIVLRTDEKQKIEYRNNKTRRINKEEIEILSTYLVQQYDKFSLAYNAVCEKYSQEISKYWECEEILITITDIIDSIIAFYKNGLAEEFLLCVYSPLDNFFNYSIKFFDEMQTREASSNDISIEIKEYEVFLRKFFSKLQQLIYTTNYSDRRSLHINAFHSVYYDVPPKLLAMYAIWAEEIAAEIGADKYSFLLSPTFTNYISLERISPQRESCNVVTITIGEKYLYNPLRLRMALYHEIAHYLGKTAMDMRQRGERKSCLIKIYLYCLFKKIFSSNWEPDFFEKLSENIYNVLLAQNVLDGQFLLEKRNRTEDIEETVSSIMDVLICPSLTKNVFDAIKETLFEYVKKHSINLDALLKELVDYHGLSICSLYDVKDEHDIEEIKEYLFGMVSSIFYEKITALSLDNYERRKIYEQFDFYFYPFKEAFSDINMTIYMDMEKSDYESLVFGEDENCKSEDISSEELRYLGVCECMYHMNKWETAFTMDDYRYKLLVQYLNDCATVITQRFNTQKYRAENNDFYEGVCSFNSAHHIYHDIAQKAKIKLDSLIDDIKKLIQ